ncbi:MAG: glycosyltransferase family 4 protein [Solirubrobacterales bacterium]
MTHPSTIAAPALHRQRVRRFRLLVFSSLFPNPRQPVHGVFVENRLRHLLASGEVEARVVAPVPWFPSAHPLFGRWAVFAGVPDAETRQGLEIRHPRYPVIPKVGMGIAPTLMYLAAKKLVARLRAEQDFDLIDAHYVYPDGVAAALLARECGKPFVVTARGTDINDSPRFPLPRAQIRWAMGQAAGCIAVCDALKRRMVELGVDEAKVRVLRNGVDLARFQPRDRAAARAELGLTGTVLLSVGLLIERKGHHLVIEALPSLPGVTLVIAGDGPERATLAALATRLGVSDRVLFLGLVPHERLAHVYSAADALVLASSREGWANVLLESMACGTPVAATDVWGTREAVGAPEAGVLIGERSAAGVVKGVLALLAAPPDRAATRRYAEIFDWDATTRGQLDLFASILKA